MPSNKPVVTLIICGALVISTWLLMKTPVQIFSLQKNNSISVRPYVDENPNTDWQKLLTNLATTSGPILDLTGDTKDFDETTLTAQMSEDFMSQYLLLKKGGRAITQDDVNQIVNNVLASGKYTSLPNVVYIASNLHITNKNDIDTLTKYKNAVNLSLKTRSLQIKNNPVFIVTQAFKSGEANELPKLDAIVTIGKAFIVDFLNIEVPKSAVNVHLALLNAISNLTSDLDGMKQIYTDPVKGMLSMNQYNNHVADFQAALGNMNTFLGQKNQ